MNKSHQRIVILDGHPDPSEQRFVHALAASYASGAKEAGHEVESLRVADLVFPLLCSSADFQHGQPCEAIALAQERLKWCTYLVVLYPLWLGSMRVDASGTWKTCARLVVPRSSTQVE